MYPNMKTTIKTLLCAVTISLSIQAQNIQITNGDTLHLKSSIDYTGFIGRDTTGFYFHEGIREKKTIYKLSLDKAKLIYQIDLFQKLNFTEIKVSEYSFTQMHLAGNKIFCFAEIDDKHKSRILALIIYDAISGKQIGEALVLDILSTEGYEAVYKSGFEWRDGFVRFHISFTPDKSKLLVVSERKKNNIEQEVKATLYHVNGLKKIWTKDLLKTYNNSTISSRDYTINDEGTLFYLVDYLRKGGDLVQGIGMVSFNNHQNKVKPIARSGVSTKGTSLKLLDNKLVCSGRFIDGEGKDYSDLIEKCGFFFISIDDHTMETECERFDYFKTSSFFLEYYEDISIVLINDCYYVIKKYNWRDIRDGDFIIYKYTKDNSLAWMKKIEKSCEAPIPLSIVGNLVKGSNFVVTQKDIRFLYYEHKKNIERYPNINETNSSKYTTLKSLKHGVLVCTTLDVNGNLKREILDKTQDVFLDQYAEDEIQTKEFKNIIVRNFFKKKDISYSILSLPN
jgi:hypothetical protein